MSMTTTDKRALTGVVDFEVSLRDLSRRHYRRDGSELLTNFAKDELARKRYARLLGVMVKQPFFPNQRVGCQGIRCELGIICMLRRRTARGIS